MKLRVALDYFPFDASLAERVAGVCSKAGWSTFLPHRDVPHPRDGVRLMSEAAAEADMIILIWTPKASEAAAVSDDYARLAARRLLSTGKEKVRILLVGEAALPLVLGDVELLVAPSTAAVETALLPALRVAEQAAQKPSFSVQMALSPHPVKARAIFISYATPELECARLLERQIRTLGLSTWFAPNNMGAYLFWPRQLFDAIQNCDAFVLLASDHSLASPNCYREALVAMEERKDIILFCPRDVQPGPDWRFPLAGRQRVQWRCSEEDAETVAAALATLRPT